MKTLHTAVITLVGILSLVAVAEAAVDLWTPPLNADSTHWVECRLINVTASVRRIQIRIYFANGVLANDSLPVDLDPYSVRNLDYGPYPGYLTCRFTVPAKSYVRAVGTLFVPGDNHADTAEFSGQ